MMNEDELKAARQGFMGFVLPPEHAQQILRMEAIAVAVCGGVGLVALVVAVVRIMVR